MKRIQSYPFILLLLACLFLLWGCRKDEPNNIHPELIYGGWDCIGEADLCAQYRMYFSTDGTFRDSICWGEWDEPPCAELYGKGNFLIRNDSLITTYINSVTQDSVTFSYKIGTLNSETLEISRPGCSWFTYKRIY